MKRMPIMWKRLVKGGKTCTRCGETHRELEVAVAKLDAALRPLGIEPVLETQVLDEDAFKVNPSESNRVWIAGKSVEEWLGADVGTSRCCSVCGDSDCRTIEVGGRTYETIPEELFIKAGLMAASQLMASASSPGSPAASSCKSSCETVSSPPTQERAKTSCCGS